MNARTLLLAAAITGLASPMAYAIDTSPAAGAILDDNAGIVEVHTSVRKTMGHCLYTANVVGHYQSAGPTHNRVSDVVIAVDARLDCAHRAPVTSSRGIYYAATTTQMLTGHVREAATLEYSPRRGTTCVAEPAMRTEATGPVFADLAMTCFASAARPTTAH